MASITLEVEEAAIDLGATRWQAVRMVLIPALWPSVVAAGLLTFAFSFDDFVLSFFNHRRGSAAAAGTDLVRDPVWRDADHQRDRDPDDGCLAHHDRLGGGAAAAVR